MEAALGRSKVTKASGIPLRKAIQGVINRTLVETRARPDLTRRNRTVALAVMAAGRATSVAAEAKASAVGVGIASGAAVAADTVPAADTEGSTASAADTESLSA